VLSIIIVRNIYTYASYLFYILRKIKKKMNTILTNVFGSLSINCPWIEGMEKRATRIGIIPIVIRIWIKMFVPVYSCGNIYLGSAKCHRQKRFNKSSNTFCIVKMLLIPVYYMYYIIIFNNIKKNG